MNERQAIDSAYLAAVENLYKVLASSFLIARGNPAEETTAETAFTLGLELNRKVYDRAKALIK